MHKFVIFSIIIVLLFSSCETMDAQLDSISLGDSYEYVVEELGNPDGIYTNENGNIVIEYYNYLVDGLSWDRGDFYIEFDKDYKVVGYGAKNVRTGNNPFSYNVTTLI